MQTAIPYLNEPCDRCGSKRRVSKRWKETMISFDGKKIQVEYTQAVCSNKVCQIAFEKTLVEEEKKRSAIRKNKEKNELERRKQMSKARKGRKKKAN